MSGTPQTTNMLSVFVNHSAMSTLTKAQQDSRQNNINMVFSGSFSKVVGHICMPCSVKRHRISTLQWRHNDQGSVSNHQPHGCLLNHLFRRRSKKTSKLRVTGLCCVGNSPGPVNPPPPPPPPPPPHTHTHTHKWPVTRKMFPSDDVIMMRNEIRRLFVISVSTVKSPYNARESNAITNLIWTWYHWHNAPTTDNPYLSRVYFVAILETTLVSLLQPRYISRSNIIQCWTHKKGIN